MSSGKLTLVAATLAGAAMLAGCGGTAGAGGGAAAGIVPAGAAAFVAIDTDSASAQWKTTDELSRRFPDRQKAIDSITRDLRKEGLDYEHDVKPALGPEIDIAWLDLDHNGEDVVGLLQPEDEDAFRRLVEKGNAKDPENKIFYDKVGDWEVVT
jgi:hypothetical protein